LKQCIWIIAGVIVTAAVAALVLRQATGNPHLRDVGIVTAITLVSSQIAMIPVLMARGKSAVTVFQSAFVGTVIHLFFTLVMGAVIHAMKWADRGIFLFLLLAFYWFSLVFVVIAMIKIFRGYLHPSPNTNDVPASNS
jgi:hypothetical protein